MAAHSEHWGVDDIDVDFSSSDDEAGVFFGAPKAVEHKIVAALSKSITATSLTCERSPAPRRSSVRLQKRDSREFLRRKTLLLSSHEAGASGEKMWEGGFHERTDELEEDEPVTGPSTSAAHHEDLSADLDTLRLDTFPSSPYDDDKSEDYFDEEEEDKENTAVPEEWDGEEGYDSEDEYVPAPPESVPMAVGFRDGQYDLDMSPGLDMGGLSLLDIDDPEELPLEFGNDTGGMGLRISLGASTYSTKSSPSDTSIASASRACPLQPNTPSPPRCTSIFDSLVLTENEEEDGTIVTADLEAITFDTAPSPAGETPDLETSDAGDESISSHDALADDVDVNSSPDAPRASSPFESLDTFSTLANAPPSATKAPTFLDTTADLIAFTPLKPNGPSDIEAVDPDLSYASDMDSPVGRAPVMIPVFAVASPPKPKPKRLNPIRSQEPKLIDDLAHLEGDLDTDVVLPTLDFPFGFGFSPFAHFPASSTSPNKKPTKSPTLSPAQAAKAQKVLARKAVAKEHLESLFSSKLGKSRVNQSTSKLLPSAQAPLATSSQLSSKATLLLPEVSTKLQHKSLARSQIQSPELSLKGKGKAPERTLKPILKPSSKITQPKPFALSAPRQKIPVKRQAPGESGISRTSSLPRPVTKRPATTTTIANPADRPPAKLFRITPSRPDVRPVEGTNTLKRLHTASQAGAACAVVPVALVAAPSPRPTLGVPSRPVRDQAPSTACSSSNTMGGALGPALVNSHGQMLSPSKPVLGKPYRPSVMTPVASRTMATPQGGLPASSRAFKLGTPSRPATTPLKQRGRVVAAPAALKDKPLNCTPIRGEEPPTPPKWINQRMDVDEPPGQTELIAESVSDMPAQAEARVMASPPPPTTDVPPAWTAPGTVSLSREGGKEHDSAPLLEDKGATAPSQEGSPPNPSEEPVENSPPADIPPKRSEEAPDETVQQPESCPPEARRSLRTRTPRPSQAQESSPKRSKAAPAESIVPGMSERTLRTVTTRNTNRNEVYLCTIDRKVVHVQGDRPPSPTSKIRTIAERDAEEQKEGREARAKRRARASMGESEDDEEAADDEGPIIERAVLGRRAPGDVEEYMTPARPAKRAKIKNGSTSSTSDSKRNSKRVRWDEGLLVIRGGLRDVQPTHRSPPSKSCVTPKARYELDEHGNAVNRPTEKLKRTTITVNAMFYAGEEPLPFDYNRTGRGKRKGKK
ncbi:uncharacterized protein CcaverHIS019_0408800 [Cutaneotrichosporon cavernicola]|uniref:Uncharacterized protein n=1 Tax=Cutaneotrichosporon cavernicola TaxID=279322 RepID=A0AA48L501_9TREE|nr:uncharacterized protein CcaverHIS019_0408800 [Cutaneotrichosporon cavernicola]BEI92060.1 hypothetical protein CcaverHIS019_0408800 [Cutaneotrichosporon cavernicola]BEI99829.1 hypothetical protein CcaverHIS631_0408720 [Cutaneotrichosporon cavernicola]BEJ07605.1 hypothetical protein CcaverHIS641_0408740 [Cutaneotrichosporon cavernicola]